MAALTPMGQMPQTFWLGKHIHFLTVLLAENPGSAQQLCPLPAMAAFLTCALLQQKEREL